MIPTGSRMIPNYIGWVSLIHDQLVCEFDPNEEYCRWILIPDNERKFLFSQSPDI